MNSIPSESRKIRIAAAIIADASGKLLLVRKRGTSDCVEVVAANFPSVTLEA